MNAEMLRSSILQKAMEGKLIPQLPEEVDVEQIGNAPDEAPFEIPNKWKWIKIKNLVTKASQKVPDKKFEYVDVSSIDSEHLVIANTKKIDAKKAPSRARKILSPGMVIYSTVRPYLLRTCVVGEEFKNRELIGSTAFASMTCNGNLLFNKYLLYCLSSPLFVSHVKGMQKGVAYPAVSEKDFFSSFVPIPPVGEQRRIVKKLEELLPLVEEYGRDQERLEKINKDFPVQMEKSLLQEAISGKLLPQRDDESEVEQLGEAPEKVPFEIPEKWKWVSLGEIAKINPSVSLASKNTDLSFVPMKAVSPGYSSRIEDAERISFSSIKQGYSKFINGDLLLAKITPCFQNRKSVIAKGLINSLGCGSTEFHVLRASEGLDPKFLLLFLKSEWFISYGVEHFKGTAGQQRLNATDLKKCPFPLPPLSEQRRIVEKLDKLMLEIQKLK